MPEIIPTERELQALKVLWQFDRATVREICDAVNKQGNDLAYTTVLSLLQVMEQKGLVGHSTNGKVYSYFAKVRREQTFRRLAKGFLETVFDGAMDEYVMHALESRRMSSAEIERLERMIAAAKEGAKSRPAPTSSDAPRRTGGRRDSKTGDTP
ncbi:MAG TPA: BlaI/MecI/CopY family transcriptional regulator [Planctomycetaceae bacterium]|jgi:predicted transcriptional regulator